MTHTPDTNEATPGTPSLGTAPSSPGERLKQAREKAGLSAEQVAKDLYLDAQVIRAIEINKFKDLAPVYAKGYLRKYAKLVGVSEEEVMLSYQSLGDRPVVADPIPAAMGSVPESRKPLPRWTIWLVVGLLIAASVVTLLNLHNESASVETSPQQSELITQPLASSADLSPADSAPVGAPVTGGAEVSQVMLRFKFSDESWVEVYDANNQQVFYEMGTASSTREITAVPPLRVVLGAASAVALQVNDRDLPVPASYVQAGVGRFVINADGQLE